MNCNFRCKYRAKSAKKVNQPEKMRMNLFLFLPMPYSRRRNRLYSMQFLQIELLLAVIRLNIITDLVSGLSGFELFCKWLPQGISV